MAYRRLQVRPAQAEKTGWRSLKILKRISLGMLAMFARGWWAPDEPFAAISPSDSEINLCSAGALSI